MNNRSETSQTIPPAGASLGPLRAPTLKQRRLFAEIQKNKSLTRAVIDAGYSRKTADKCAGRILRSLSKTTLRDKIQEVGIDSEFMAQHLMEGLDALRTVSLGDGNHIKEPDWHVRHKYMSLALKIMGLDRPGATSSPDPETARYLQVCKRFSGLTELENTGSGDSAISDASRIK